MVSASDTDIDFTVGKTGGEKTHTLTVDELASHSHDISVAEGNEISAAIGPESVQLGQINR